MKQRTVKISRIFIVFLFLFCSSQLFSQNKYLSFEKGIIESQIETTVPDRIVTENGFQSVEVEYLFKDAAISEISVDEKIYTFIHIDGFGKMTEVGKPALPCFNDIFAVPDFASLKITILDVAFKDYGEFLIHPALQPASDLYGAPSPDFEIDDAIYQGNEFFPVQLVETVEAQKLRGTELNFVQIRPVQFNPATKTIRVYSKIKYRIDFIGARGSFNFVGERSSEHFCRNALRIPLNRQMVERASKENSQKKDKIQRTNGPRKDYIIITTPAYTEAARLLANWKRQLGFGVEINIKSTWSSSEVKDSLRAYYENWTPHPDFFVIIGDHPDVPGELKSANEGVWATDLHYACMDGVADWMPDIARGRISVANQTQAIQVVNKIINYEKNPPTSESYYHNGLNCAYFQDYENYNSYEDRRFLKTCEDVRNYLMGLNYSVIRVYSAESNVTPLYWNNTYYSNGAAVPNELRRSGGFTWSGDSSDIITQINQGRFFVLHRDHGWYHGWGDPFFYDSTCINLLNNTNYPTIVFSMNCQTGGFYQDTCFTEAFLRHGNGGAAGILGASQVSYSGYNDAIACALFDAIWPSPGMNPVFGTGGVNNPPANPHSAMFHLADVMDFGLIRMLQTWAGTSSANQYQFELYHWFGDPSTKIWTAYPQTISADFPSVLPTGSSSLSISNCSCPNATATLVYNGKLQKKIILNEGAGEMLFDEPTCYTPVTLTISQTNYRPLVYIYNPNAAALLLPENQEINISINPLFDWENVPNATKYHLQISDSLDFSNILYQNSNINSSQLQLPSNVLSYGNQYYWRLRSVIAGDTTDWSCVWSFKTMRYAPFLTLPSNGTINAPLNSNLIWKTFLNANRYSLQISTNPDFSTLVLDLSNLFNTSYSIPIGILDNEETYYWRVKAKIGNEESEWSDVWSFTTIEQSFVATIGTESSYNSSGNYPAPYGNWYWGAKHQFLIKQSELMQLGFMGGNIFSLAFDVQSVNNCAPLQDFYIKMKHSNENSLSGFDNSGNWTQLSVPATFYPVQGWNTHTFSTPFAWNGVSNIIVEICFQNSSYTGNASTRYSTTPFTSVAYRRLDGSGVCGYSTITETSYNRPNMQLNVTMPQYSPPNLQFPPDSALNIETAVNFAWSPVSYATKYALQLSTDANFSNLVINNANINLTQFSSNLQYDQNYYWRVRAIVNNNVSPWSEVWTFKTTPLQTHNIALSTGWNNISSYVEPEDLDLYNIFGDIENELLFLKNGRGGMFVPAYNFNSIGDWNKLYGYICYLTQDATLSLTGRQINPEQTPIELSAGWTLIPYLCSSSLNPYLALNSIIDNLIVCKNGRGGVFVPSYQINTIGNISPDWSYYVYLNADDTLLYPANSSEKASLSNITHKITHKEPSIKPDFSNTGNDATLLITLHNAKNGDELLVFNSENKILGTGTLFNSVAAITIWGDDESSEQIDGAVENEALYLKLFDAAEKQFKNIQTISIKDLAGQNREEFLYQKNTVYFAESIALKEEISSLNVYPNPLSDFADISFSLEKESSLSISIFNTMGVEVLSLAEREIKAEGNHAIHFSAKDLLSGIYYCTLKTENKVLSTKFVIIK